MSDKPLRYVLKASVECRRMASEAATREDQTRWTELSIRLLQLAEELDQEESTREAGR